MLKNKYKQLDSWTQRRCPSPFRPWDSWTRETQINDFSHFVFMWVAFVGLRYGVCVPQQMVNLIKLWAFCASNNKTNRIYTHTPIHSHVHREVHCHRSVENHSPWRFFIFLVYLHSCFLVKEHTHHLLNAQKSHLHRKLTKNKTFYSNSR